MKVLFFGDLAATGFGTVTTDLGRELLNLGLDVRFISQNDTGTDLVEPFRSRTVNLRSLIMGLDLETGEQGIAGANELIPSLVRGTAPSTMHSGEAWGDWKPDVCLLLGDYRGAQMIIGPGAEAFREVPTLLYIPVEGNDLPPAWNSLFTIAHPVAMSKFGARQLAKVVGHEVPMIYHGVDTERFRPIESRPIELTNEKGEQTIFTTREQIKRSWAVLLAKINQVQRVPHNWMLRTDRNMPRKQYARLIRSLAPVLTRHPNWGLVIHCQVFDQGGFIADTVSKFPAIRERILFTDNAGLDRETLASLYNACDIYVTNSAEGFGLTIAEALACGLPAVGVRYSAVPEVIGPAGVTVERYTLVDNEYDHYWCAVDERAFAVAVEGLIESPSLRAKLGAKGPKHIASSFSWVTAARSFADVFEAEVAAWHPSPPSLTSEPTSVDRPTPASSAPASLAATSS